MTQQLISVYLEHYHGRQIEEIFQDRKDVMT